MRFLLPWKPQEKTHLKRIPMKISFCWRCESKEEAEELSRAAAELEKETCKSDDGSDSETISVTVQVSHTSEGLFVEADRAARTASIGFAARAQFCRAFGILTEKLRTGDTERTEETPCFRSLTYMQDNSRNAVKKPETVKTFLRQIALMGYTSMMLYTEDTYEIAGEPYFGYMRGRFTAEELKDLDRYAGLLGIELIPCIQTLAHLGSIFRWPAYRDVHDTADILLCGEEKTYALIEKMVRTCRECFSSGQILIGMDEAHMLGRGVYQDRNGAQDHFRVMMDHLNRVLAICDRCHFRAMMWSDMFFKLLTGGEYYNTGVKVTEEFRRLIPENVTLVYWDYYTTDPQKYAAMFRKHREMTDRVAYAGGAWKWSGPVPLLHFSRYASAQALPEAQKAGIADVIVTDWGDDGAECSSFVVTPILAEYAEYLYRRDLSEKAAAERLRISTGENYDDMMMLDCLNYLPGIPQPGQESLAPAKYLLYQDPLQGLFDVHIQTEGLRPYLKRCGEELRNAGALAGEMRFLFASMSALADLLSVRADLGIRLREAYAKGDRNALAQLADRCGKAGKLAQTYHEKVRAQWAFENKPFGYEVLDIRLAGVEQRLKSAEWTLQRYLCGEISSIPELEQEQLPVDGKKTEKPHPVQNRIWSEIISASVVTFS